MNMQHVKKMCDFNTLWVKIGDRIFVTSPFVIEIEHLYKSFTNTTEIGLNFSCLKHMLKQQTWHSI